MVKAFRLARDVDETGVSGTGIVAEGVEFSDGVVALRWTSDWPTSVVFHERGIESVEAIHGHGGKTRIVWVVEDRLAEVEQALLSIAVMRQEWDDFDHPDFDWRLLARRMESVARAVLDKGTDR